MGTRNDWKEVTLSTIADLRKTTKNFLVETDDIRYAIKVLKSVNYKKVYFYRSEKRRIDGVDPYYKILAVLS